MMEKYSGLQLVRDIIDGKRDKEDYYWGDFAKDLRAYLHDVGGKVDHCELDILLGWAVENARWEFDLLELMGIIVSVNKHWLLEKALMAAAANTWPDAFIVAIEGMIGKGIDPREYVREVLKYANSSAKYYDRKS